MSVKRNVTVPDGGCDNCAFLWCHFGFRSEEYQMFVRQGKEISGTVENPVHGASSGARRIHKVLAYVTRTHAGRRQLLVFDHRDFPEAGRQVPAGTVEPGEAPEAALVREVEEESGLSGLEVVARLAVAEEPEWGVMRHVYHLVAPDDLPDRWEWLTNDYHDEEHRARDERLVFLFYWLDLTEAIELAAGQGRWLAALTKAERATGEGSGWSRER
jgi:8-oxo-dGTP pyrophosphatase MutT (NUDIX family)